MGDDLFPLLGLRLGRIQARTRLPARPNTTVNSAPSRRRGRASPNPLLPVLGLRGRGAGPQCSIALPNTPAPLGCPQAGSRRIPPARARAAWLSLPTPPRAPERLGTLLCSPFLLPGYNYTSPGGSGNTSFFPRAPLGIASGTAGLISHAPGLASPPRRFLLPGSTGTALAQPRPRSPSPPQPAPAFAPQPGSV